MSAQVFGVSKYLNVWFQPLFLDFLQNTLFTCSPTPRPEIKRGPQKFNHLEILKLILGISKNSDQTLTDWNQVAEPDGRNDDSQGAGANKHQDCRVERLEEEGVDGAHKVDVDCETE